MVEQGVMGQKPQVESFGEDAGNAAEASRRLFDDLYTIPEYSNKNDLYKNDPELKNGLASESLQDIEKWHDDARRCGLNIDQDKLTEKLIDFGKKTSDMWDKMEKSPDENERLRKDQDTMLTYSRWQNLLFNLPEQNRIKAQEALQGSRMLQGGE